MSILWIIIGTLLVAGGGLLATYGWSARTDALRKSAMVRAIAAELLINISVINDRKFTETDEKKLSEFTIFPRMQTASLAGALSSGLFLEEKDRLLLTRISGLYERLLDFNRRLEHTEDQMRTNPWVTASLRTEMRDGRVRQQLIVKLRKLGVLLMTDHGIKESDQFFVSLEEDAQ